MAEVYQPSSSLEKKLLELNQRRATDIPLTIGSTVGGATAGLATHNPGAAVEMSRQLMRPPAGSGDQTGQHMAELAMKKDIADAVAKYSKDIGTAKLSAMEKMNKSDELFKAILGASANAFGVYGQSLTSAFNNYDNALVEMNKNWGGALADVVKQQSPANAGQIQAAFERIRDAMAGSPTQPGPDTTQYVLSILQDLQASGDDAGAEALIMKLEAAAPAFGVQSFNSWLEGAARAGDQYAGTATELSRQLGQAAEMNNGALLEAMAADQEAVRRGLKLGVPDMDKALDMATKFMDKFGGLTDPSQVAAAIDEVLKGPVNKVPLETYEKLLAELDNDNLPPASNLAEARRRLLSDPEFVAWMKDNGFQDPGMALKELRRIIGDKAHTARQDDRTLMQQRRGVGITAESGGRPTADVVAAPGTAGGAAPAGPSGSKKPGFVLDKEGIPWIYGEDGKLREPTPEEIDKLDAELSKLGDPSKGLDQAVFDAVIAPASEFGEVKKLSDEVDARATGLADNKAAAQVNMPEVGPGIAKTAAEVGYGIFHPKRTAEKVDAGIRSLFDGARARRMKVQKPEDIHDDQDPYA